MTFGQAIASGFRNYTTWSGRASRSEFWWWYLFSILVMIIPNAWYLAEVNNKTYGFGTVLYALVALALVLPTLAMTIRRLHDTNRSGGWWWIQLIPFVGSIILLVFMFLAPVNEGNRFNK